MTNYNELRDGQEFFGNGYKKGYKEGYKQAILDGKTNFSRQQGEWKTNMTTGDIFCSCCKESRRDTRINHINFCNSCGADMRKGEAENGTRLE